MKIRKERKEENKFKNMIKHYLTFYKKNLRKKHIVVYILSLVVFTFFMVNFISNLSETNKFLAQMDNVKETTNIFSTIIKEKIPLVFLLIFSGITPFIYIPVIGIVGYPYILSVELINMSTLNMIISTIGGVIQLFGISLAISAGIYYCTNSTKRFRYDQTSTFGIDDVKLQIYEATKKEDKLNKLKDKKQAKLEKREKLNVKIEYKALLFTTIVSTIIVVAAALITGV